jgi:hypothetical protein
MNRRFFLSSLALSPLLFGDFLESQNDVFLKEDEYNVLLSLNSRLRRVKQYVGYGNFNLISFSDALFYARNYPKIGAFKKEELLLIERLFYETPQQYGFYGVRTCTDLNNKIAKKDVVKVAHTGHYLFKGKSQEDYTNVLNDIGEGIILTSGVRNVVKQLSLYTNKIVRTRGNMTKATNAIAPPAYSYHTISDFDVGKVGWGYKNFTAAFAKTVEFKEMKKLDYIGMRYKKNNKDGVRFEPWHVEVI